MKQFFLNISSGSNQSSDEIHVSDKANTAFNPLKQKGGFKILKKPISGMFLCLLVFTTFAFTSAGCRKLNDSIVGNTLSNFTTVINFTTVAQGNLYQTHLHLEGKCFTITTDEEWDSLKVDMNMHPYYIVETEIDFSTYLVIAVFDSIHTNGGWSIDVTNVTEYYDKIEVSVSNLETGDLTAVITHPFHIVKIPVSNKEIVFNHRVTGNVKTGYIMDYVQCTHLVYNSNNDSAQAIGYNIISENLQDTFETYNLSDYISKFPVDFFHNTGIYRYSYKIEFEYENTNDAIVCPTTYLWRYPHSKKIRITSLNLIN
jgi:hypothetical protein